MSSERLTTKCFYSKQFTLEKLDLRFLSEAAKKCNWRIFDSFVRNGGDINASLVSSGPETGYTALHFAVLKKDEQQVLRLIRNHNAKIDSVGADGAQPVHLACLLGDEAVADHLLETGADPDAELTKELYGKYGKIWDWSDDFGDRITLLTFAVLKDDVKLVKCLLDHKANVGIKGSNNKTLLMHAIENDKFSIAELLLEEMEKYQGLINARDGEGWHAVHYFLPNERSKGYWYDQRMLTLKNHNSFLEKLIRVGGDAMVKDDPDTLLINMAAERSCLIILETLFNVVLLSENSKPLSYATLSIEPNKFMQNINEMERKRELTLRCILEDMSFRREFGLFVPEEEIKLMDHLVATDEKINKIVGDYEEKSINGIMKNEILLFGNQFMTIYDLVVKVFDDRALKSMVKDDSFAEACKKFYEERYGFKCKQIVLFSEIMIKKITTAEERRKLLERVERIEALRKVIPLPYEVVLIIIEYVDNKSLKNFVEAFYQDPIASK